ncbi:class I SAM-dependent methyltransferase [Streptomyces sp. NPDC059104]|uniref:class I SAM-dependent methyltransferase n=1 Tax=Streptomyces sp. NPDC059104 TaxID=3346729 RepID=UPI003679222E
MNTPQAKTAEETFFGSRFGAAKLDTKIERAGREAEWILERLTPAPRVLDLGCGRGRLSIALRARGATVTGLDINGEYLRTAEERAGAAELSITWRQGSFLDLADEECFDGIVSMFTSFGYHDEEGNAEVLRRVSRALVPGGVFVLEVLHRDAPGMLQGDVTLERTPEGEEILKERSVDLLTSRRTLRFRYLAGDTVRDGGELVVRMYALHELIALFDRFGLDVEEVHSNARGVAFTPESEHIVLVGRRRTVAS